MSGLAPEPIHSHIQWVLQASSPEIKQLICDVNHSPTASAGVKNVGSYMSPPSECLHSMDKNNSAFIITFLLSGV